MCVGIPHQKLVGRICNTWGRISCIWLEKKIFFRELWKLFTDNVMIFLCSHYDDVFLRDDPAASVVGLLDEGLAGAGNIKKLLRLCCSAEFVSCVHSVQCEIGLYAQQKQQTDQKTEWKIGLLAQGL